MALRKPFVLAPNSVELANGDTLFTGWLPAPQGRLTLTSGTPVMTAAASAATAIIYTPYVGNLIGLWNGIAFAPTAFVETSQALSDATKSPTAATAGQIYDLFGWLDGVTFRVTRGPPWTAGATAGSNTARGQGAGSTALTRVQGVLVNTNAITNGPAAGFGTYLGTIATDASAATVTFNPGSEAAGGGAAVIGVWNAYNRSQLRGSVTDSTASWTYASTTVRNLDGGAANGGAGNRVTVVSGDVTWLHADLSSLTTTAANGFGASYILGLNGVSTINGNGRNGLAVGPGSATGPDIETSASFVGAFMGLNYLQAMEQGSGSGAAYTSFGFPYGGLYYFWEF